jgi:hypothetical protein
MHHKPAGSGVHRSLLVFLVLAMGSHEASAQSSIWETDWFPHGDTIFYTAGTNSSDQGHLSYICSLDGRVAITWAPETDDTSITEGELVTIFYQVDDGPPESINSKSIHPEGRQEFAITIPEDIAGLHNFLRLWSVLIANPPKRIEFRTASGLGSTFSLEGSHEAMMHLASKCGTPQD